MSAMPDIEAAVMLALVNAGVASGRVYPSNPATSPESWLRVQRLGGVAPVRERLDAARIQCDAYAGNKGDAFDLIEATRAAMMAAEGTAIETFECFVTAVNIESGPSWIPDAITGRDRYMVTFTVYAHTTG
jgi:hypothetical protein